MFWLADSKQKEETIKAWEKTIQAFDQIMIQEIKECFFSIRVKIMIKILHHLHKDHRLALYDAEIFIFLEQLFYEYKKINDEYRKQKTGLERVEEQETIDVLNGIMSILLSEYQQFYEHGKPGINPIQLEKEKYISLTKQSFIVQLQQIEQDFIQYWLQSQERTKLQKQWIQYDGQNTKEIYLEQIQHLYQQVWQETGSILYTLYQKVTVNGMNQMDDFDQRPTLHLYYEFVQNQKNTLESICNTQINVLKKKIEQEIPLLQKMEMLGDQLEKKVYFWEQGLKNTEEPKEKLLNFTCFEQYIQQEGIQKYVEDMKTIPQERVEERFSEYHEVIKQLQDSWHGMIKLYIEFLMQWEQKEYNCWKDSMKQEKEQYQIMMEKILTSFHQFQTYYQEQEEFLLATKQKDSFAGINETLAIKIQSIEEEQEEWKIQIKEFLGDLVYPFLKKDKEDKEIPIFLYKKWVEEDKSYSIDPIDLDTSLESILKKDQEEGYAKLIQEKMTRWKEQSKQQWDKIISNHLKDQLLFEISTFEEVLHYSISRIREETEEIIQQYVIQIDDLTKQLYEALEEYGINFISPKPHEKFNGREQEVLLAEKNENFQKGEIIKCINTGYRYQGQVLLRANVIAAR